jgi:hypothetical protein
MAHFANPGAQSFSKTDSVFADLISNEGLHTTSRDIRENLANAKYPHCEGRTYL